MIDNNASPDDFVAVALAHGLLQENHVARLHEHALSHNVQPSDAALSLSMLRAIEVEAINLLCRPTSLAPGYELTGLIGCGAGGMVFRAHQEALNREVALKTINPRSQNAESTGQPRILREAHAIAKLQHPGIVAAYDSGFHQGRFCIAMELVEGENLVDFIERQPDIPEQVAWHLARQVAFALSHACDAGIIHRDIKPANLLLCKPPAGMELPPGLPCVKVADFGLATDDQSTNQITATGATLGTPAYVAPEQLSDPKVDARADIYSLGATVFHMLSGHPPCIGQSPMKTIMQKTIGDDRWRNQISAKVSPKGVSLFRDMTEADPDERISDYPSLIQRIDEVLANIQEPIDQDNISTFIQPSHLNSKPTTEQKSAIGAVSSKDTLATNSKTFIDDSPSEQNVSPSRGRGKVVLSLALLAIAGLGGIAWFATKDTGQASESSRVELEETKIEVVPDGFPQPLFNGSSAPLFQNQSGLWLPASASDGSRVLAGEAGSWFSIPLSINSEQIRDVQLRVGVNLAIDSEAVIEIVSSNPDSMVLASIQIADGLVRFVPEDPDATEEHTRSFPSTIPTADKAVFRRLAFVRRGDQIYTILNGEAIGRVPCKPTSSPAIKLRSAKGTTNFADIDIVAIK